MGKVDGTGPRTIPVRQRAAGSIRRARRSLPMTGRLGVALVMAVAALAILEYAPDDWLRAVAFLGLLLVTYRVGWIDGRRDFALDLVRSGRDDRPPGPTPSGGEGAADSLPPAP